MDWVAGASMVIRRDVLDEIGLFDEQFFLYFEETDLCLRAAKAGHPTYYVPESRVTHIGSASTGLKDLSKRLPTYWFESRRHYIGKHHGKKYLWGSNLAWAGGHTLWQVRRRLQRKPPADPPHLLADFLKFNFIDKRP